MYATDLADRMEYQIIPALRSGFIVLADRYIYTLLGPRHREGCGQKLAARPVRICREPDLVFYLQLGVEDLVPRVLEAGKMNYWESGLDMNYGDDLYDSFVAYQTELIQQFNVMSEEFGFHCLDVQQDTRAIQRQLRREMTVFLESCDYPAPGGSARGSDVQARMILAGSLAIRG